MKRLLTLLIVLSIYCTFNINANSIEGFKIESNSASQFEIIGLQEEQINELGDDFYNITSPHKAYRILNYEQDALKGAIIRIGFDEKLVSNVKDIQSFGYNEVLQRWQELEIIEIDELNSEVVAKSDGEKDYINGIIKTPELPTTKGYVPTQLKDLDYANPAEGIISVNPPDINNYGGGFAPIPIDIPAGRNGMQPQLAFTYNQNGGRSRYGYGWDMNLPAITIDTRARRGIPRYDEKYETETYLLNGQMLSPYFFGANYKNIERIKELKKGDFEVKYSDNSTEIVKYKEFHYRIEGSFQRIRRYGNQPDNYFWEVTKNGVSHYYGCIQNSGGNIIPSEKEILQDKNGNKAYWPLLMTKDIDGNFIRYNYFVDNNEIYIKSIEYTLSDKNNSLRNYDITFGWKENKVTPYSDGRLGFIKTTNKLLNNISIKYIDNNTNINIRKYEMTYSIDSLLLKTKLDSIKVIVFDDKKQLWDDFYDYTFKYHSFDSIAIFQPPNEVSISNDNITANFINPLPFINDKATAISGNKGESKSFGGAITIGPKDDSATKSMTAGVDFSFSSSSTEGFLQLINITPDGKPDKVFLDDKGNVKYRRNLGNNEFGEIKDVLGLSNGFFNEESKSQGGGFQLNGNSKSISGFIGVNSSSSSSETTSYFTEVNADNIIDIVHDGKVYFNITENEEEVKFTDSLEVFRAFQERSYNTKFHFRGGGKPAIDLSANFEKTNLLDVSFYWQVPKSLTQEESEVNISGDLYLDLSSECNENLYVDGVDISVEQVIYDNENDTIEDIKLINKFSIAKGDTIKIDTTFQVAEKDLLLFRVHSKDNGECDQVAFNPIISYGGNEFSYLKDVVFTGENTDFIPPFSGQIKIDKETNINLKKNGEIISDSIVSVSISDTLNFECSVSENSIFSNCEQPSFQYKKIATTIPVSYSQDNKNQEYIILNKKGKVDINGVINKKETNEKIELKIYINNEEIELNDLDNSFNKSDILTNSQFKIDDIAVLPNDTIGIEVIGNIVKSNFTINALIDFQEVQHQIPLNIKEADQENSLSSTILFSEEEGETINIIYENIQDIEDLGATTITLINGEEIKGFENINVNFRDTLTCIINLTENNFEEAFKYFKLDPINLNNKKLIKDSIQSKFKVYYHYSKNKQPHYFYDSYTLENDEAQDVRQHYFEYFPLLSYQSGVTKGTSYFGETINNWGQFIYNYKIDTAENKVDFPLIEAKLKTMDKIVNSIQAESTGRTIVSLKETWKEDKKLMQEAINTLDAIYDTTQFKFKDFVRKKDYTNEVEQWKNSIKSTISNYDNRINEFEDSDEEKKSELTSLINQAETDWFRSYPSFLTVIPPKDSLKNGSILIPFITQIESTLNKKREEIESSQLPNILPLTAKPDENRLTGIDNLTYIEFKSEESLIVSASRLGRDRFNKIKVIEEPIDEDDVSNKSKPEYHFLPSKYSKSKSKSIAVGVTPPLIPASGSYNYTNTDNEILRDIRDMNGDGYPDIVGVGEIQYTNLDGSLGEKVNIENFNESLIQSKNYAHGISASGTYLKSKSKSNSTNIKKPEIQLGDGVNSAGISGSFGWGTNENIVSIYDFNGDGLSDIVDNDSKVRLNYGYGKFSEPIDWGLKKISGGKSKTISGGLGFTIGNGSFSGGVGLSQSNNEIEFDLIDMDNDGLIDYVEKKDDKLYVQINTGTNFSEKKIVWAKNLSTSSTASESANGAVNIAITIPTPVPLKLCINPSASISQSMSRVYNSFTDIDGDGYQDYIESDDDGNMTVALSNMQKVNKLQSIITPLNAEYIVDYRYTGNDSKDPRGVWAIDYLTIKDGVDADENKDMIKTFDYRNAFFDRNEHENYGFQKTASSDHYSDGKRYRTSVNTYLTNDYFFKGLLEESMFGSDYQKDFTLDSLYSKSNNEYELDTVHNNLSIFPKLTSITSYKYEGTNEALSTKFEFEYDDYGNINKYTDFGYTDSGSLKAEKDNYTSTITYHNSELLSKYHFISLPKSIEVKGGDGNIYRKKVTTLYTEENNDGNRIGQTKDIIQYYGGLSNNSLKAVTNLEYDKYGNVSKITNPKNHKDQRLHYEFTYDNNVKTYVTGIKDAYGYSSQSEYDYRFGIETLSTDMNNVKIKTEVDNKGRITSIGMPFKDEDKEKKKEKEKIAIEYEYFPLPDAKDAIKHIPYAITYHTDELNEGNKFRTLTFIDGLERPIQTKKDITVWEKGKGETNENEHEKLQVSGRVFFDDFGRVIKTYYPTVEEFKIDDKEKKKEEDGIEIKKAKPKVIPLMNQKFIVTHDTEPPVMQKYDVLDRVVKTTLQDKAYSETKFIIGESPKFDKQKSHITIHSDLNGVKTYQARNVRDLIVEVGTDMEPKNNDTEIADYNFSKADLISATYNYNPVNEVIDFTDPIGLKTAVVYDMLGRKTSVGNNDIGETTYKFDAAGNMIEEQNAELREDSKSIRYIYEFERLEQIKYPKRELAVNNNNVKFVYGSNKKKFKETNSIGRVVMQLDASGAKVFEYDLLGNLTLEYYTIVIPAFNSKNYLTEYKYDYLGRLKSMVFPDEEKIIYKYNNSGLVNQMISNYESDSLDYVKEIRYDKFEKRTYIQYLNDVISEYSYEPERRRLNNKTTYYNNKYAENNTYEYNSSINILSVKSDLNECEYPGQLNCPSNLTAIEYDNMYRLKNSKINFKTFNKGKEIEDSIIYNNVGNILSKIQNKSVYENSSWNNSPIYADSLILKSQPSHLIDTLINSGNKQLFSYTRNGNLEQITDYNSTEIETQRSKFIWDYKNRLDAVYHKDKGYTSFIYDNSGNRVIKIYSSIESVHQSGGVIDNISVYPNRYYLIKQECPKGENFSVSAFYQKSYFIGSERVLIRLGEGKSEFISGNNRFRAGGDLVKEDKKVKVRNSKLFTKDEFIKYYNDKEFMSFLRIFNNFKSIGNELKIDNSSGYKEITDNYNFGETENFRPKNRFYFIHSSLVSNTNLVSNFKVEDEFKPSFIHNFQYTPFGERLVLNEQDVDSSKKGILFTFNSKEYDSETGLYDYGARYYSPKLGVFISPDAFFPRYIGRNPKDLINGGIFNISNLAFNSFCGNDPINKIDRDGNAFNVIIGGLVGGIIDAGTQGVMMAAGLQENFSYTSLGISIAAGASNVGLGSVLTQSAAKFGLSTGTRVGAQLSTEVGFSLAEQAIRGEEINVKSATIGAVFGEVSGGFAKFVKPMRKNGNLSGISISLGSSYGAKSRIDIHKLRYPSKKSNSMSLPKILKNLPLPHYHRGKGNNLKRHRPWEKGWNDKSFLDRF